MQVGGWAGKEAGWQPRRQERQVDRQSDEHCGPYVGRQGGRQTGRVKMVPDAYWTTDTTKNGPSIKKEAERPAVTPLACRPLDCLHDAQTDCKNNTKNVQE